MLENYIQTLRLSCKSLANSSDFNANIAHSPRVIKKMLLGSQNGIKYPIFPCPIYISSSAMAKVVRQVAILGVLVSQHAAVTHRVVVA